MLVYVKKDGFGNFQSLFIIFPLRICYFTTKTVKMGPWLVKMVCRLVKWGIRAL